MTAARTAGLFLLLTALATAISVPARLLADADQPTLSESLWAIALNNTPYLIGGVARLVSGLALLSAAWFLWRSLRAHHPTAICIAATALAASGLVTAISGLCAVVLATSVSEVGPVTVLIRAGWEESLRLWADARWITGTVGFTLAGVGLIALGPAQWRIGGILQSISRCRRGHRRSHAVHLGGCRHRSAPDLWHRLPALAHHQRHPAGGRTGWNHHDNPLALDGSRFLGLTIRPPLPLGEG